MKTELDQAILDSMSKNPNNWKGVFYYNRKDPTISFRLETFLEEACESLRGNMDEAHCYDNTCKTYTGPTAGSLGVFESVASLCL